MLKNNCNITAGYNAKIFIKGNCEVRCGQYSLVIDSVGGSKFFSEKGTKFNVVGINTFNCVDSTISLQYRKTTSAVVIPNRECILKKEIPNKCGTVEKDKNGDEDEEGAKKLDKSYNILEYKDGTWSPSNNIYPFDWSAIERNRKSDKKRKLEG